jgi:hypothetical protein
VNPQEINLIVREGPRLSLGDVTIEGVSGAQNKKLVRLFQRPAEKDRPIGSGPAPFREEDVGTGLSYLRQELHAQGFWAAEAEEISRETDAATGDVDLSIRVRPGELHRIGKPVVRSGDGRGVMRTTTTVEPFIGKSATTANLNEMRLAVEEAFISRGYPDAKIRISRTIATPSYIPGISIDLGVRVKLLNVRVEGLERVFHFPDCGIREAAYIHRPAHYHHSNAFAIKILKVMMSIISLTRNGEKNCAFDLQ